jgi:hypothetical protein
MTDNHTPKRDPKALAERLRTHSEQVRNIAWENLRADLIDAAGTIERQSQAIAKALDGLQSHDEQEGNCNLLDEVTETLREASDDNQRS